jgi:hypothetical protein
MTRLMPLKIFAASVVLSAVGAVAGVRADGDKTLAQLAGYRGWTRVTREPLFVSDPAGGG